MTRHEESVSATASKGRKAFRRIVWIAAVVVPLALVWPCWHVISQVTGTRSAVLRYVTVSGNVNEAVDRLGTPDEAAGRLGAFVRMPKWVARDESPGKLDLRYHALGLLGACGEAGHR